MVKFDLNVLDKDYDVFKSNSGLGLMTRAKNVLTTLKNTNADARVGVLRGNNDDELNDDGKVVKRLIDDIANNESAQTILGIGNIGNRNTPA